MDYYFPSCNFQQIFPVLSKKIQSNLLQLKMVKCCREDAGYLKKEDRAVAVCTNCILILKERTEAQVVSLYDVILHDEKFIFPDLIGQEFVIQHCAKSDDTLKNNIESIMIKMGATIELSSEKKYCGTQFMQPVGQRNLEAAYKTFSAMNQKIDALTKRQQKIKIEELIELYSGKIIVTYCNSCYCTLSKYGAKVIHVAELLFAQ